MTVRLGGTSPGFRLSDRRKPFQRPIRVYLVSNDGADQVRSRADPRLHFVGRIVPDLNAHGILSFVVPPLDTDTYVAAAWCPGCASTSSGRTFFVLSLPEVSRYRDAMAISVRMPDATSSCPVTAPTGSGRDGPTYGNGFLSTTLRRDGSLPVLRRDGVLFQKLPWIPHRGLSGKLIIAGERLDGPGEMRVLGAFWGHSSDGRWSWASPVEFPSEGCWRITGRVADVSLSYVVKVVAG